MCFFMAPTYSCFFFVFDIQIRTRGYFDKFSTIYQRIGKNKNEPWSWYPQSLRYRKQSELKIIAHYSHIKRWRNQRNWRCNRTNMNHQIRRSKFTFTNLRKITIFDGTDVRLSEDFDLNCHFSIMFSNSISQMKFIIILQIENREYFFYFFDFLFFQTYKLTNTITIFSDT